MADNAAENALKYLRDPAIVAGLGAVAVASMYYLASRPTPQPCPVDPQQQSYELPDGDYARMNSLTTELVERLFDDVNTTHEAFLRGVRLSGEKPCLGYRSSPGGPYAWLTYNEVFERSTDTGSGLLEVGCHPGDDGNVFVGVYAPNKIEWVFVEQACSMFSLTIVPLYDTLGPEACVYIINQARMMTVVCDESKIKSLLEQCDKCPKLKNVVKIGSSVTDEDKAAGEKVGIKVISFQDLEELGKNHRHEKKPPKPDDLAVVCYTSGTTGNPKGAMITHRNAIAMLSGLVYLVEQCGIVVSDADVHMSYLPLAHMYERLAQLMIFTFGGKVGFFGGNARNILDDLQALKPTVFISVPRVLNRVYDRVLKQVSSSSIKSFLFNMAMRSKKAELERNIVRRDSIWDYLVFRKIQKMSQSTLVEGVPLTVLAGEKGVFDQLADLQGGKILPLSDNLVVKNSLGGRVRFLISGSAPLRDDVMIFLRCALGCQVIEGYGQTETTAAATLQMIGDQTYGHVGPPLPCNKIKLVDVPDMEYYAKDGKGEICFYGPNVFKGYLYDEKKTKEAIDEDGWLHSGDVGEWQQNGTLKVIDRKKHIFKLSQGEYIAPEKIEQVYTPCPMIHQVYVHGDSKKSCLIAVVVPEKDPVQKWAEKNGVQGDIDSLCTNEKVKKAILDQMTAEGKKEQLKSFEQVKAISLTPEIWSVENGLLTPTLKFKRPALKNHFTQTFEDLYSTLPE